MAPAGAAPLTLLVAHSGSLAAHAQSDCHSWHPTHSAQAASLTALLLKNSAPRASTSRHRKRRCHTKLGAAVPGPHKTGKHSVNFYAGSRSGSQCQVWQCITISKHSHASVSRRNKHTYLKYCPSPTSSSIPAMSTRRPPTCRYISSQNDSRYGLGPSCGGRKCEPPPDSERCQCTG